MMIARRAGEGSAFDIQPELPERASFGKIPCLYEDLKFSEDTLWDDFLKQYLS